MYWRDKKIARVRLKRRGWDDKWMEIEDVNGFNNQTPIQNERIGGGRRSCFQQGSWTPLRIYMNPTRGPGCIEVLNQVHAHTQLAERSLMPTVRPIISNSLCSRSIDAAGSGILLRARIVFLGHRPFRRQVDKIIKGKRDLILDDVCRPCVAFVCLFAVPTAEIIQTIRVRGRISSTVGWRKRTELNLKNPTGSKSTRTQVLPLRQHN